MRKEIEILKETKKEKNIQLYTCLLNNAKLAMIF
jgi:peroxiredoxin family protein